MLAFRQAGVIYTNTTARPIYVSAHLSGGATGSARMNVDGVAFWGSSYSTANTGPPEWAASVSVSGIVPIGSTYTIFKDTAGGFVDQWAELR